VSTDQDGEEDGMGLKVKEKNRMRRRKVESEEWD